MAPPPSGSSTDGERGADAGDRDVLAGDVAASVDRDRLMAHIAVFAQRVKLSGTPEELESFRILEGRMRDLGFRTRLLSHDAYVSLPGAARLTVAGRELPCITHSMAVSTGPDGRRGRVVPCGEGREEDFAVKDLAGAVALVDGIAVEDVAHRASRAGAVGIIHVSPTEHRYEMCISPVWGSPSHVTLPDLPSVAVVTVCREDGAWIYGQCGSGVQVQATLVTEVDTGWRQTPLLVCDMDPPGGGTDTPFVLFSGHHDTWHYGVMDNGGANATMIEAARVLASRRDAWRRSLRVCFWSGHSHGRYSGSAWYADEEWIELDRRCAAHVNVDSTGAIGATVLTDSGVIDELAPLARAVIAAETGQVHKGRRQGRAADQSFWGAGVPSMFGSLSHQPPGPVKMLVALGWWWHTPHDLADKIDPDHLARDTRIAARVLAHLLADPVLPLDYAAFADSLRRELAALAPGLADGPDLAPLHEALAALDEAVGAVTAAAAGADAALARRLDAALMRTSRQLVPINYTRGDRFRHDPAMPMPAWPTLQPLRELAAAERGTEAWRFRMVEARQARNRIHHALLEATDALRAGLDTEGTRR